MKSKKIFHTIIGLLLSSNLFAQSGKNNASFPDDLLQDRPVLVKGIISHSLPDQRTVKLIVNNAITSEQDIYVENLKEDGSFVLSLKLLHPVTDIMLDYGDIFDTFLAFPGDTVILDTDHNEYKSIPFIRFAGTREKLNTEYYAFKKYTRKEKGMDFNRINQQNTQKLDPAGYKTYRTTIRLKDDSLLISYKKQYGISAQLEEIISLENLYAWADDLIRYRTEHIPAQMQPLSDAYLSFITTGLLNNPRALLAKDYGHFIKDYQMIIVSNTVYGSKGELRLPTLKAMAFAQSRDTSLSTEEKSAIDYFIARRGIYSDSESAVIEKLLRNDYVDRYYKAFSKNLMFTKLDSALQPGLGKSIALSARFYRDLMKNEQLEDSLLQKYAETVTDKIIQAPVLQKSGELNNHMVALAGNIGFTGKTLSVEGSKVLNEIIAKYKGKVIYIDFWATWCAPCLDQMVKVKPLKDKFKDIVFLYLCVSSPEGRWKFVVQDMDIKGEHYLLSADQYNYLGKEFNIGSIPHYIAINKKGELTNNAPGPSQEQALNKLMKELSGN